MTAIATPKTTPSTIAPAVPRRVPLMSPSRTGLKFMIRRACGKFHRSFVRNELATMATTTAMAARATQRHGWGTGRAWIAPGRSSVPSDT